MKQCFTLFVLLVFPLVVFAQQDNFQKSFQHFEESRGDTNTNAILTLPYEETVALTNALNSSSGLGPTFNYYGTVVVVDQMNRLPNGELQLVLRREDGRDFYGFRPTLKAVLTKSSVTDLTMIENNN
jgi:hypothetical protein